MYFLSIRALFVVTIIKCTESFRILVVSSVQSRSHYSMQKVIIDGLLSRDHEVTEISYFVTNKTLPRYKGILIGEQVESYVDTTTLEDSSKSIGCYNNLMIGQQLETATCEIIFSSGHLKELISSKVKNIDLLIAEAYYTQCYHLLAYILNVPLIMMSAINNMAGGHYFTGSPYNPSYNPLITGPYTTKMNFFQRMRNSIDNVFIYWYHIYVYNKNLQKIARQHCNMELPSDEVLNRRTALGMSNNHFSFIARPKSLNAVDIAGIHIKPVKRLPKDLEDFIEESPQGVILFSLGSTIKASSIPDDKMKIITDSFSGIPQRVLWRVDQLNITHIPSNVKLVKWMPQRDILDHPKVVGFISHCGLFGTLEAIHTATPILGIPITFDQFQNANILTENGVCVQVEYSTMNKEIFMAAIKEILSPRYRENMQRLSHIFKDRPMSPLNEALYWIEYVLKHQGAPHLRTQAADMPLYQYLLLDVILFLLVTVLSLLYLIRSLYNFIVNKSRKMRNKDKTT